MLKYFFYGCKSRVAQLDTDLGRMIRDIAWLITVHHILKRDGQGNCMVDHGV